VTAAVLLLIAAAPLEYGYYTFLRLAVTAASVWIAIVAGRAKQTGWTLAAVFLAIVFNPLIPVWLSKGVWMPIDVAGAALLTVAAFNVRGPARAGQ
jgi:hypothetical protein